MKTGFGIAPLWGWLAVVLGAATQTAAQEPQIRTEVQVAEITVGDQFQLVVGVEHAAGIRVVFPDSLDLSPFEALRLETGEPVPNGGGYLSIGRYTLTAFELGELEIPSFDVAVIAEDGTASTLSTSPWGVVVGSVGRDESGDIRDVKAPFFIPLGSIIVAAWALGVLLLAALLYWLYRRHQSQNAAEPILVAAPIRRPWEVAEDALREVEGLGMVERGEIKDYYIRVSEIIRAYVEAQFHVPALEMASFEVVDGLATLGLDSATVAAFEGFLAECDLVKFAKFRPDPGRAQELVPRARRLVERTKVGRPAPPKADGVDHAGVEAAATEGEASPAPAPAPLGAQADGDVVEIGSLAPDHPLDPAAQVVEVSDLAPDGDPRPGDGGTS